MEWGERASAHLGMCLETTLQSSSGRALGPPLSSVPRPRALGTHSGSPHVVPLMALKTKAQGRDVCKLRGSLPVAVGLWRGSAEGVTFTYRVSTWEGQRPLSRRAFCVPTAVAGVEEQR